MPIYDIDYSNTIFYKIYCKDENVTDLYVGHTTNFVQRKYAHKRACTREKDSNYKQKVYQAIRNNGGWENWKMVIIGFHECECHYDARKIEQQYFEDLNATLNSIHPLPKPKPKVESKKIDPVTVVSEQIDTITEGSLDVKENKPDKKFYCEKCDYKCNKKSDYEKHLMTRKHKILTNTSEMSSKVVEYVCECGKQYKHRQSLYHHKKNCKYIHLDFKENKSVQNFYCEKCDFGCSKKSNYEKHLSTAKHTMVTEMVTDNYEKNIRYYYCACGKQYKHRQNLYHHKKNCKHHVSSQGSNMLSEPTIEYLLKENLEMKQLMIRLCKMIEHKITPHEPIQELSSLL